MTFVNIHNKSLLHTGTDEWTRIDERTHTHTNMHSHTLTRCWGKGPFQVSLGGRSQETWYWLVPLTFLTLTFRGLPVGATNRVNKAILTNCTNGFHRTYTHRQWYSYKDYNIKREDKLWLLWWHNHTITHWVDTIACKVPHLPSSWTQQSKTLRTYFIPYKGSLLQTCQVLPTNRS